ncbi:MAG: FxsA family protein [Candidatus Anammoximicrobium sp.]|nr:FxsA family protein [Candidatus Anammoximicrobium sp.]
MLLKLLLLFLFVPLAELVLLLYLADATSWQMTLGLVIATGVVGTLLAKSQGWRVWSRIHAELAAGQLPAEALLDAALIFVAGALLLTPGILTDLLGFSLLIPWTRNHFRRRLVAWFKARFTVHPAGFGSWPAPPGRSEVIDSYVVGAEGRDNTPDGGGRSRNETGDGR